METLAKANFCGICLQDIIKDNQASDNEQIEQKTLQVLEKFEETDSKHTIPRQSFERKEKLRQTLAYTVESVS